MRNIPTILWLSSLVITTFDEQIICVYSTAIFNAFVSFYNLILRILSGSI